MDLDLLVFGLDLVSTFAFALVGARVAANKGLDFGGILFIAAVASISGGTDICGCFMLGVPNLPVYAGQIQGAALGLDVQIYSESGQGADIGVKGELVLNSLSLVSKEKEVNGRFTLYTTENIYNFLLLDQIDGDVYQVQWSMEEKNRGIVPIK